MTYITGFKSRITSRIEQSDGTSATFTLADNPGADGAYTLKLQNEQNTVREWMTVTTVGTTATIVLRGLSTSSARTEVAANKLQWREGSIVKIVADKDDLIDKDDNNLAFGDGTASDKTITMRTDATTDPTIYTDDSNDSQLKGNRGDDEGAAGDYSVGHLRLTTAERDALTSPLDGMTIYNTTTAVTNFREAGAWVANAAGGSIPAATTTSLGGLELGTATEVDDGTTSGSVGPLAATPDLIAGSVQDSAWTYVADAEASDTYVITLVPAISGYVEGAIYSFKANTANTGAATLNVNAKGALAIKKANDQDLETGDIEAGQIVIVQYDGTDLQMQSQVASTSASNNSVTYLRNQNRGYVYILDGDENNSGAATVTPLGGVMRGQTGASSGDIAGWGVSTTIASLHDKNPEIFFTAELSSLTNQDVLMGFGGLGSPPANNAFTNDHAAFLVADGVLIASVANGTTQTVSSTISGITLTDPNNYSIVGDGTDYKFFVNGGVAKATLATNLPNSGLKVALTIQNQAAANKILDVSGILTYDL